MGELGDKRKKRIELDLAQMVGYIGFKDLDSWTLWSHFLRLMSFRGNREIPFCVELTFSPLIFFFHFLIFQFGFERINAKVKLKKVKMPNLICKIDFKFQSEIRLEHLSC